MDIKFVNPGFQYMLDSIMEFQKDDSSFFWNNSKECDGAIDKIIKNKLKIIFFIISSIFFK